MIMMLKFKQHDFPKENFKEAVKKPLVIKCKQIDEPFEVETMEGIMKGKKGDWLMMGVKGELYPCDQNIFNETYDIISHKPSK